MDAELRKLLEEFARRFAPRWPEGLRVYEEADDDKVSVHEILLGALLVKENEIDVWVSRDGALVPGVVPGIPHFCPFGPVHPPPVGGLEPLARAHAHPPFEPYPSPADLQAARESPFPEEHVVCVIGDRVVIDGRRTADDLIIGGWVPSPGAPVIPLLHESIAWKICEACVRWALDHGWREALRLADVAFGGLLRSVLAEFEGVWWIPVPKWFLRELGIQPQLGQRNP